MAVSTESKQVVGLDVDAGSTGLSAPIRPRRRAEEGDVLPRVPPHRRHCLLICKRLCVISSRCCVVRGPDFAVWFSELHDQPSPRSDARGTDTRHVYRSHSLARAHSADCTSPCSHTLPSPRSSSPSVAPFHDNRFLTPVAHYHRHSLPSIHTHQSDKQECSASSPFSR